MSLSRPYSIRDTVLQSVTTHSLAKMIDKEPPSMLSIPSQWLARWSARCGLMTPEQVRAWVLRREPEPIKDYGNVGIEN